MALFRSEEIKFRTLHLGGGSVHGISQNQPVIFLEELAGIPVSWQFDMIGGESIGSDAASVLVCPQEKGSHKPKFSAKEYDYFLKKIAQDIFEPYQEDYYTDMVKLEVEIKFFEKAVEIIDKWAKGRDRRIGMAISDFTQATTETGRQIALALGISVPPTITIDPESKDHLVNTFNLYSGLAHTTVIPVLQRILDRAKSRVKEFFFSPDKVHKALDEYLRFSDGSPVMLSDTITGFYSEAFNINKQVPEAHSHIKPIKGWDGFISHKDLPLADIPKRSMPAQTIFKPYQSPYSGCYYDDIARVNTMASVMNHIRRKFTRAQEDGSLKARIKRSGISIGTGIRNIQIDPVRMGDMLLLERLDPSVGAPLNIPLLVSTFKAVRDLKEELGKDNAVFVDKISDPDQKYDKDKYRELLKGFTPKGKEFVRADILANLDHMPESSLIDARSKKITELENFGIVMIWDHLEQLVQSAKDGLHCALRRGLVTETFVRKRMQFIDQTFPPHMFPGYNKKAQGLFSHHAAAENIPFIGFLFGNGHEKNNATDLDHSIG